MESVASRQHSPVLPDVRLPEIQAAMEGQGAKPVGSTPAELARIIADDTARWGRIVREANIKAN